jgi:hypothetical protein
LLAVLTLYRFELSRFTPVEDGLFGLIENSGGLFGGVVALKQDLADFLLGCFDTFLTL